MNIPKKLIKGNKEYIFIKEYLKGKYALYEDNLGLRECFKFDDLGLVKEVKIIEHNPFQGYIYKGGTNDA